jgi:hypothetical protein
MCGENFHGGRHNESLCLISTPPSRLHFRRRPAIIFIRPTPLPNVTTLRNRTPLSSIPSHFSVPFCSSSNVQLQSALRAIAVDQMVTFSAALLQTRQTAVSLHLLSSFVHSLRQIASLVADCSLACFIECLPLFHVVVSSMFQFRFGHS